MTVSAKSVFYHDSGPVSVAILLLDETSLLAVAATIDPMRAANRFANRSLFSWTVATADGEPALLTSGVSFPANVALHDVPKADILIVLAGFNHRIHAPMSLTHFLRRNSFKFRAIGSVDSGGWVLARAGLLDGHRATVHWEDLDDFARAFASIDAVADRYVVSRDRFSAGGAVPTLDLMLHLIRSRYGAALAVQVASAFIYDDITSGNTSQKSVSRSRMATFEPTLERAIEIMAQNIEDPISMGDLAGLLGVSRRQVETRFRARLGISPGRYATDLRLQAAARLARDSSLTFTEIAVRTGFSSQAAFTRTFRLSFGLTPGTYRKTHSTIWTEGKAPKAK